MAPRLCLLAAALAFTASAAAQAPQRWTHPAGLWSVDVGSVWGYSEGIQPFANVTMTFTPAAEPAKGEGRTCLAWEYPDFSLRMIGEIHKRGDKVDLAEAGKLLASFGQTPSKIEYRDVDGFTVSDIESASAKVPNRSLVFFTPVRDMVLMTMIQCMWDQGTPAARMAEINTLLTSLRIRNVDAKP